MLGYLKIDAAIFYDPHPLFTLDARLVLEWMMRSLRMCQQIRITSRIFDADVREGSVTPTAHNSAGRTTLPLCEVFEARTLDGVLIEELGRREIIRPSTS